MNETTTAAEARNKSGATLEVLYDNMINSQSYINYKTAAEAFANKLNYTGNIADINTDAKLLTWVRNNVSTTGFTSYADAETEYNNVRALGVAAVNDNFAFYEALDGVAPERLVQIIGPTEPPQTTEDCEACKEIFETTVNNSATTFSSTVMNGVDDYFQGEINGSQLTQVLEDATTLFKLETDIAANEFVKCCLGM